MFNIVYRWVWSTEEAMDIVQESFFKLWQTRTDVNWDTVKPFLYKIALNKAANKLRWRKLWKMLGIEILFKISDNHPTADVNLENKKTVINPPGLLIIMSIATTISFQIWRTLLNNFTVEAASFTGQEIGMLQSLREIPGFLAFGVVFLLLAIKEQPLAILSIMLLAVGTALTGFLMVEKFKFPVSSMALLFIANQTMNMVFAPKIGRFISKWGERRSLLIEYTGLIVIFLAYAYVETAWIAIMLYIIDHFFFSMAIAQKTYFQKIADPADFASTAGVAFSINHIAAVLIPVLFGLLWLISPAKVFMAGAILAAMTLCLSALVPHNPVPGHEYYHFQIKKLRIENKPRLP